MIVDSVFDGHRLAREIDSPNPEMPLPFIRERRLWGDSATTTTALSCSTRPMSAGRARDSGTA